MRDKAGGDVRVPFSERYEQRKIKRVERRDFDRRLCLAGFTSIELVELSRRRSVVREPIEFRTRLSFLKIGKGETFSSVAGSRNDARKFRAVSSCYEVRKEYFIGLDQDAP